MSLALYRFYWDCGRMGDVDGTFVASSEEIEAAIGKMLEFGEILGKHSDVRGTLDKDDLTVLTADQDFIAKFQEYVPDGVGYNPLNYLPENLT